MSPKTLIFTVGLGLLGLGITAPASTAFALRCGTRLVTVGDSATYVRSVCGEPTSVSHSTVSRSRTVYAPVGAGVVGDSVSVTIEVETWIYDFGRRRFMEELIFENGNLIRMRPLSYGTTLQRAPSSARLATRAGERWLAPRRQA